MGVVLTQIQKRIADLELVADEVSILAERLSQKESVQPELSIKGQQWYRGARELMVQHKFSGLEDFENCYKYYPHRNFPGRAHLRAHSDIETYTQSDEPSFGSAQSLKLFNIQFLKARSLVKALMSEMSSRELPVTTQLSFALAAGEFDKAQELLDVANQDEAILRASGVVARVALERHLFTVADARSINVIVNPPTKKKPTVEDVTTTFLKTNLITPIQKSQLDHIFKIANNCAHPKESIIADDVQRLIREGRLLASTIL